VTGLGGASLYPFGSGLPGSAVRYNENFGTGVVEADSKKLSFQFFDIEGERIDEFSLASR
jgi:hypothetical protein